MAPAPHAHPRRLSTTRIAAHTLTILVHALLVALVMLPLRPPAPTVDLAELGTPITVTFITHERPAPPPPPPPPPPKAPVLPKEVEPVHDPVLAALTLATEPAAAEQAEVFELPPLEVPDFEPDAVVETIAEQSEHMFDAMAHGAEPDPDWEPTELLSFRSSHPPVYPPESRRNGEKGWVVLRVLIGLDGEPLRYAIDPRTTASERLIQAAIDAVDQWRFNPAYKDGNPVRAWMVVPIGFFISTGKPGPSSARRGEGGANNES